MATKLTLFIDGDPEKTTEYNVGCTEHPKKIYDKNRVDKCYYYRDRYRDFMDRHKDCNHIPPEYYYGKTFVFENEKQQEFYNKYALTSDMEEKLGINVYKIKFFQKRGVKTKPLLATSYGFKYCVRFSKVLRPKLSKNGKKWLDTALDSLQCLMDKGVVDCNYEAKYDELFENFTSLKEDFNEIIKKSKKVFNYFEEEFNQIGESINGGIDSIGEKLSKLSKHSSKLINGFEYAYNNHFEPTKTQLEENEGKKTYEEIKEENMSSFYTNIELNNKKFQEFAFATHPDAYNPKKMSELPISELFDILLTPDYEEYVGENYKATLWQAAIVVGNMAPDKVIVANVDLMTFTKFNIIRTKMILAKIVIRAGIKFAREYFNGIKSKESKEFITKNTLK